MNRIDDLKDETIRTLAQTLRTSGLAASETEAIRMATNMAQTNKKANTTFEERKERNTMGLSFLHKDYKKQNPNQEIVQEEVKAEIKEEPQSNINEEPQSEEHDCAHCAGCSEPEMNDEPLNEEKPLNDLYDIKTNDEFIDQDLIKEEDEQPETTQEIKTEEKPKRDLSKFNESKVDLGDVFKFKG